MEKALKLTILLAISIFLAGIGIFAMSAGKVPEPKQDGSKVYGITKEVDCSNKLPDGKYYLKLDSIPVAGFVIDNGKITFNTNQR